MKIKFLVDEDFINYKKPSMFIGAPYCTFKCDKEAGTCVCQNSLLAKEPIFEISNDKIVQRYKSNPITKALVIGGLEPFDDWDSLLELLICFRSYSNDDIIIYTGYYPNEIQDKIKTLLHLNNIYVKYGRFIPDRPHCVNELLGVELSSDNQFCIHYLQSGSEISD